MDPTTTTPDPTLDLPSVCVAITQHAPLPIATVEGATHIVRYANPAFCRLMDEPLEKLIGKPLSELLPEKDECIALLDRVFRARRAENHIELDDTKPHPVFWSYTMWPVLQDEGLVGVMLQVTETAEAHGKMVAMNEALVLGSIRQHELAAAAERLSAQLREEAATRAGIATELSEKARLLDLTHDAIIVRDMEGEIRYWNNGAEELYGWSREEALGKISHLLLQTEFPTPLAEMTGVLHRTGRWIGELVHTKRDGKRITVHVRKTLDRDREGNPVAVLENITDITARRELEDSLAARAEDLLQADRSKDEFLAMLAHELRNPLAPLRRTRGHGRRLRLP
ncbi:MAG TPA: PAS domain-containing protein [Chthoniobacteraceae bacterium]|nr:PAS domain-containing protein [Chthoniobacteraceae bacterium]